MVVDGTAVARQGSGDPVGRQPSRHLGRRTLTTVGVLLLALGVLVLVTPVEEDEVSCGSSPAVVLALGAGSVPAEHATWCRSAATEGVIGAALVFLAPGGVILLLLRVGKGGRRTSAHRAATDAPGSAGWPWRGGGMQPAPARPTEIGPVVETGRPRWAVPAALVALAVALAAALAGSLLTEDGTEVRDSEDPPMAEPSPRTLDEGSRSEP